MDAKTATWNAADDDSHKALRAAICQPVTRHLWTPADAITFTPALCDTVWGDGRALLGLTTINNRPAYYVGRIDSSIEIGSDADAADDAPELWDILDDIKDALEEQFGDGRPGEEIWGSREEAGFEMTDEEWEYGDPWPAMDDRNGCSWWRIDWPEGVGATEPHPYHPRYQISKTTEGPGT